MDSTWDSVLRVLRDPLFALAFSVFLALLASQAVGRFLRWVFILGSLAMFIWLVTRYRSFADVVVAVVGAGVKILLPVLCLLAVVAVAAIVSVLVMYLKTESAPGRGPDAGTPSWKPEDDLAALPLPTPADAESALVWLDRSNDRMTALARRLSGVLERIVDQDDGDSVVRAVTTLVRVYFSGLTPYRTEIRQIHRACDGEIENLARTLPSLFTGVDAAKLNRLARARYHLPDHEEWRALSDDEDLPVPYFAMRLFCLHRRWREVATVLFKCYYGSALLAECLEAA